MPDRPDPHDDLSDDPDVDSHEPRWLPDLVGPNLPESRHRFAGADTGTGRSHGNESQPDPDAAELLDLAADMLDLVDPDFTSPQSLHDTASALRAAGDVSRMLFDAAIEYDEADQQAAVLRRKIERKRDYLRRREERRRERLEQGYPNEPRRPNRPVHVEVDPEAWDTVKRDAMLRQVFVGRAVAALVSSSVDDGIPAAGRAATRAGQTGRRARRFARLFLDDDTWARLRARALDADVTSARAIGLVVEAEARSLGWRPSRSTS